ncbi:MAG: c-type cytochrome, partial [Bryobacteraceae bacterium]
HGPNARGPSDNTPADQRGSDLVRSLVVLHDRYGSDILPFLKKGHPLQSGRESASLTPQQIADLSHFLHEKVDDTLRSGPYSKVLNILTGDSNAGKAFFNGAGKCDSCHSPTGDLAGIARKYDPPTLQQRFLFPRTMGFGRRGGMTTAKPVTVTVTPSSGPAVTGVLIALDDFNVSLRDASGEYRSFKRTQAVRVEKKDPYQAHIDVLDVYTNENMHDILAYLETLK